MLAVLYRFTRRTSVCVTVYHLTKDEVEHHVMEKLNYDTPMCRYPNCRMSVLC